MSSPLTSDLDLAIQVVHCASVLTKNVLRSLHNSVAAETKADDSPVTVADFAAQALIIGALHAVYPTDSFIGEESAAQLRENPGLAARVWELVKSAPDVPFPNGQVQNAVQLIRPESMEQMLEVIDLGQSNVTGKGRVWVLDPVDGTATFMKGQQYAVCLCLLVDGIQQLAVTGCPNLKLEDEDPVKVDRIHEDLIDAEGYGVALHALKGYGTFVRRMRVDGLGPAHRISSHGPVKDIKDSNFVEATIGKTSLSQAEHSAVAQRLGASWPGTVLWSQQLKYVALALGATDIMVRIPKTVDRYTYLWDHAGGQLLFQEAGGLVKDFRGGEIDLGNGRQILGERNFGMIGARPEIWDAVLKAVNEVLAERKA